MIISCEKCEKKFQISDELIPDSGRLLQCGSCSYQWHYAPNINIKKQTIIEETNISTPIIEKKINTDQNIKSKKTEKIKETKKTVGILSYIIVLIISLIALIILADTFKLFLKSFIPNIDSYLLSLYESLTDIFLFLKDLIK